MSFFSCQLFHYYRQYSTRVFTERTFLVFGVWRTSLNQPSNKPDCFDFTWVNTIRMDHLRKNRLVHDEERLLLCIFKIKMMFNGYKKILFQHFYASLMLKFYISIFSDIGNGLFFSGSGLLCHWEVLLYSHSINPPSKAYTIHLRNTGGVHWTVSNISGRFGILLLSRIERMQFDSLDGSLYTVEVIHLHSTVYRFIHIYLMAFEVWISLQSSTINSNSTVFSHRHVQIHYTLRQKMSCVRDASL